MENAGQAVMRGIEDPLSPEAIKRRAEYEAQVKASEERQRELRAKLHTNLLNLTTRSYAASVKAGWHSDIETGKPIKRNRPEMLMLMVSECAEGHAGTMPIRCPDEHLPQFTSMHVEMADCAIRLGDYCGAHGINLADATMEAMSTANRWTNDESPHLMVGTAMHIAKAMEHLRKGRNIEETIELGRAMATLLIIASREGFNLFPVCDAKMDFNAQRADHKIENRKLADGKKF